MRVAIDWNLCVGSGDCVRVAPGGFQLVPCRGELRAALVGGPSEAQLVAAARACPTLAIRLADDAGHAVYPPPRQ